MHEAVIVTRAADNTDAYECVRSRGLLHVALETDPTIKAEGYRGL